MMENNERDSIPAEQEPAALRLSLLLMRLSIAVVMGFWTVDKMVNPEHAQAVFKNFYGLGALSSETLLVIGLVEAALVAAFATGLFKTFTYGAVLALHAMSTFSSWRQYLDPFENLLFFRSMADAGSMYRAIPDAASRSAA